MSAIMIQADSQEYSFQKPYSEKTSELIDEEISKLIESAYERAKKVLTENKTKLEALAKALLDKEVIFREDLEEIFGKRPFDDEPAPPALELKDVIQEVEDKEKDKEEKDLPGTIA
jgi:ATP-dependent Zn protease